MCPLRILVGYPSGYKGGDLKSLSSVEIYRSVGSNPTPTASLTHKLRIMITFRESCKTIFAYENDVYLGAIVLSDDIEYERYKDRCNGDKLLKIVRLETSNEYTNKGIGSALIRKAIELYPEHNMYLLCHPMPRGNCDAKHKTVSDLKRFYSKFGFVSCGELLPTMIRKATI